MKKLFVLISVCVAALFLSACSSSASLSEELKMLKNDGHYMYPKTEWGASPETVEDNLGISLGEPQAYYGEDGEFAFDLYEAHGVRFAGESWEGHFQFDENGLWAVSLMMQDKASDTKRIYDRLSAGMEQVYGSDFEAVENTVALNDGNVCFDTVRWSAADDDGESLLSLSYNCSDAGDDESGLSLLLKWNGEAEE